jgi:elongation factor Ts
MIGLLESRLRWALVSQLMGFLQNPMITSAPDHPLVLVEFHSSPVVSSLSQSLLQAGRSLPLRGVSKPGKAPGFETGSVFKATCKTKDFASGFISRVSLRRSPPHLPEHHVYVAVIHPAAAVEVVLVEVGFGPGAEGLCESYIHGGGRIGVLLEINCETDFVAKTDEFKSLAKDICLQIAASKPEYVRREEVPADILEKEKEIFTAQALNEGKPANVVEKMIVGRIEKFYKEICLLEQPFIKNMDITIQQLLVEQISKIGENINVRRFARYELGEGLEKRKDNFAEEVMAQIK